MINEKLLEQFEKRYEDCKLNKVIENAISNVGIDQASINQEVIRKHSFVFSDETKKGEITNQKRSGRCWIFSGLNVLRASAMENLNVENLEFSQAYLQFYDKLEKANTYLTYIIETKDLDMFDRLVMHILPYAAEDGGYWNFFSGLVKKYGVIPKECMPETHASSETSRLNEVIDIRLKKAATDIRNTKSLEEAEKIKEEALYKVYNILVKTIGKPPKTVEFEYKDKDKNYHKISGITPLEFLNKYVKESVEDMQHIVADPRESYEKARLYEVPYTVSVMEEGPSNYLNVSMEELKAATIKSIKAGIPVWFGCDVVKDTNSKLGIMDTELFDYDLTLNEVGEFSKADRLVSGASMLTHAMTFVGVDLDENGKPLRWMVENSWGDEHGKKGIFSMSDKWFEEHNYEVVVDKKFISEEFKKGFEKEKIVLPFYDNYLG